MRLHLHIRNLVSTCWIDDRWRIGIKLKIGSRFDWIAICRSFFLWTASRLSNDGAWCIIQNPRWFVKLWRIEKLMNNKKKEAEGRSNMLITILHFVLCRHVTSRKHIDRRPITLISFEKWLCAHFQKCINRMNGGTIYSILFSFAVSVISVSFSYLPSTQSVGNLQPSGSWYFNDLHRRKRKRKKKMPEKMFDCVKYGMHLSVGAHRIQNKR